MDGELARPPGPVFVYYPEQVSISGDTLYRIISYLILSVCLYCYWLLLTPGWSDIDLIERRETSLNGPGRGDRVFWMSKN